MTVKVRNKTTGQAATEYMLVVSVVVIAAVGAAYAFYPTFRVGVEELGYRVADLMIEHGSAREGVGLAGSTVAGNGGVATSGQAESSGTVGHYDPMAGLGDVQPIVQ